MQTPPSSWKECRIHYMVRCPLRMLLKFPRKAARGDLALHDPSQDGAMLLKNFNRNFHHSSSHLIQKVDLNEGPRFSG